MVVSSLFEAFTDAWQVASPVERSLRKQGPYVRGAFAAILILVLASLAIAGDWQPNPELRHRLVAPLETPQPAFQGEDAWVDSLLAGLRRGGADPKFVYRLSRSSAMYEVNGEPSSWRVFVSRDNPDLFVIVNETGRPGARFIVDFKQSAVDAHGHGTSLFVPQSGRFAVIVLDRDWGIGGIPVTGGESNPLFRGRTATWY